MRLLQPDGRLHPEAQSQRVSTGGEGNRAGWVEAAQHGDWPLGRQLPRLSGRRTGMYGFLTGQCVAAATGRCAAAAEAVGSLPRQSTAATSGGAPAATSTAADACAAVLRSFV